MNLSQFHIQIRQWQRIKVFNVNVNGCRRITIVKTRARALVSSTFYLISQWPLGQITKEYWLISLVNFSRLFHRLGSAILSNLGTESSRMRVSFLSAGWIFMDVYSGLFALVPLPNKRVGFQQVRSRFINNWHRIASAPLLSRPLSRLFSRIRFGKPTHRMCACVCVCWQTF